MPPMSLDESVIGGDQGLGSLVWSGVETVPVGRVSFCCGRMTGISLLVAFQRIGFHPDVQIDRAHLYGS